MTPSDSPAELLVRHTVRVCGVTDPTAVAERTGLAREVVEELLLDDEALGLTSRVAFGGRAGWTLTDRGKATDSRQLAQELAETGARPVVEEVHRRFEPLNARLVRAGTDWQLRPDDSGPFAVNDHQDRDWDDRVLNELDTLSTGLTELIADLRAGLTRFAGYDERFARALAQARAGHLDWVTGLEVQSCHTVWMQLHEDLLSTLGIERGADLDNPSAEVGPQAGGAVVPASVVPVSVDPVSWNRRVLYILRHGEADTFGEITDRGLQQAHLIGERLASLPIDAIWHSTLPRAAATAEVVAQHVPGVPVAVADELIDHVPHVPSPDQVPPEWAGFFDGFDPQQAAEGRAVADALLTRFTEVAAAQPEPAGDPDRGNRNQTRHEVLITHAYPIAWLVRAALGADPERWLSLTRAANTGLTVIEYQIDTPPTLTMVNDQSHLPAQLRWTGFGAGAGP